MSFKRSITCTIALIASVITIAPTAQAQFAELAKRIPSSANTIVLWNAEKVFNSPIAKREGWSKSYDKAFAAGLVRLPSDTQQYMAASKMEFTTMQPLWQVSMITTRETHSLDQIARLRKGTVTTIAGHQAVLLPSNSYLVQFSDHVYGSMSPADRQTVARWIRETDTTQNLSPYLREALGYADNAGTEIVMAMDLQDVLAPEQIEKAADKSPAIKQSGLNPTVVARIVSSLQGVTLGITFADQPYGKIKADFGLDATILGKVVKPLFLEVIGNKGVMIDDFQKWTGEVQGKRATLSGYFSKVGMRRVLSLIDEPATTAVADTQSTVQSASDKDPKVVASKKYFKSIDTLLTEFRHRDSPKTIYQIGTWLDKYARKIDRLPMVNVDKELIQYGTYVAQQLRNASAAIKGIGYRTRVGEVQAANSSGPGYYGANYDSYSGGYYYDGNYYRGGYGYGGAYNFQAGLQAEQKARTQVHAQARVSGAAAARAILQQVLKAEREVRVRMTQKYNEEF